MNKEILQFIKSTSAYERLISRFKELHQINSSLPLLVDGVSEGALYSLLYSLSEDIRHIKKARQSPPVVSSAYSGCRKDMDHGLYLLMMMVGYMIGL